MGIGGFLLAVLSVVLWFPFYRPSLTIAAPSTANPLTGMPLLFTVQKNGVFNAYSVDYRCYYASITISSPVHVKVEDDSTSRVLLAKTLTSEDPVTFGCEKGAFVEFSSGTRIISATDADVAVIISFKPQYDWRQSYTCAHFVLGKDNAGKAVWFRRPTADCEQLALCLDRRLQRAEAMLTHVYPYPP